MNKKKENRYNVALRVKNYRGEYDALYEEFETYLYNLSLADDYSVMKPNAAKRYNVSKDIFTLLNLKYGDKLKVCDKWGY